MLRVLVDADIIPYELGYALEQDGVSDWPSVQTAITNRVAQIMEGVTRRQGAVWDMEFWLSDPEGTFRQEVATIQGYKAHRTREKPFHWEGIRAYLRDQYNAQHLPNLEGDDALLIRNKQIQAEGNQSVIAGIDKDLKQTFPLYMYTWGRGRNEDGTYRKPEQWFENETDFVGWRNLWTQMLVGDRADNILGLFGVGEAAACVKKLSSMRSEQEMAIHVHDEYVSRFASYADQFFGETYCLLKLLDEQAGIEDPVGWQLNELAGVMNAGA